MMTPQALEKLQEICRHYDQINDRLNDQNIYKQPQLLAQLTREKVRMQPLVEAFHTYQSLCVRLTQSEALARDKSESDEMRALASDDSDSLRADCAQWVDKIRQVMLAPDDHDKCNVFLEIRAGTGGIEAGIFVNDLLQMYLRYAEYRKWHVEILHQHPSELGGYKEMILRVSGDSVYAHLKFESGAHRVQRVPETESQGRIHTSACTVAVLPEIAQIDEVDIDRADLRIDTFRASGAGGQHINKTDSAVRITHFPSGIVVECQNERSQHKNREQAMSLLKVRILEQQRAQMTAQQSAERRSLVGSGDRSERIRTYNFPQGRVTDHRIHLTLYKLNEILLGDLEMIITPLIEADHDCRWQEFATH